MAQPRYKSGPKKGQFKPGGRARKSSSRRKSPARKSRARATRTRRRNPDILKTAIKGGRNALWILGGEAAAKAVPQQLGLPTTGAQGLAMQAGVAVAVGMVADRLLTREAGARVLEGALSVPLRSLIVQAQVPVVSQALSGYVVPARRVSRPVRAIPGGQPAGRIGGYVMPRHLRGTTRTLADRYEGAGVI